MNKKEIKNHLLTAQYGKFDFIDTIVPDNVLQIAPPRVIVQYLVAELGIEKSKIQMNTLRSWLFNYRRKTKSQQVSKTETKGEKRFTFSNTNEKKFNF